jgi:hypothetical protein
MDCMCPVNPDGSLLILPPGNLFCWPALVSLPWTSAQLRGWWQPSAVTHPVFVSVPSHDPHPQRRALHVSRHPRPVPSEYDGEKHRGQDTHRADLTRERRLVKVNVQRVGSPRPSCSTREHRSSRA